MRELVLDISTFGNNEQIKVLVNDVEVKEHNLMKMHVYNNGSKK